MPIGPVIRAMLRNKLRFGLIAFEVALSFAIVVNCVTMIHRARARMSETLTLVAGRGFTADDVTRRTSLQRAFDAAPREKTAAGKVAKPYLTDVVISDALARVAFGDEPALDKLFEDRDGDQYRVVGVVGTFYNPYAFNISHSVLFYPLRPQTSVRYLVRAEPGRKDEVVRALEPLLLGVDPGRNFRIESISELYTRLNAYNALAVRVLSLVLFLVVFVTFLGVVGVTSFSVTERTRQIGIRRALGAQRGDVVRHFLLENAVVSGLGLGLGVALAFGLNVALVSHLGASRLEVATIVTAIVGLALGGQLAALAPALRAARVAPTIATRNV
jgi:putative ABC transport system permease protein